MNRIGDWFQTYTGRKFYPLDPRAEDVCIVDIAHALANICRFGGHTTSFYSVAEHSVLVSDIIRHFTIGAVFDQETVFKGLMHDATEAYVGDMIRPLKRSMSAYKVAEHAVWLVICEHFQMSPEMHPIIKEADNRALMTERRDLLKDTGHKWSLEDDFPPIDRRILHLDPFDAENAFIRCFKALGGHYK
jgi:uncharacterized protein